MVVIGIFSGKGGVGKTTIVSNIGVALTKEFNQNVLIVDANVNSSHLGMHLGMYEDLPVTLRDVLKNEAPLSYAIHIHPTIGVRILPAPLSPDGVNLKKLKNVVEEIKKTYDLVVMDTTPGLGRDFIETIPSIDIAYVVTTPDLPALADTIKTIKFLEKFNKNIGGVIVNRVANKKYELFDAEIENTCGHKIVATIHEDKKVPESIQNGVPIVVYSPSSNASIELKKLAAKIIGTEYKSSNIFYAIRELLSSISRPKRKSKNIINPIVDGVGSEKQKVIEQRKRIKKSNKNYVEEEISDIQKIDDRLREDLKKELKQEILKRIKEKMREKDENYNQ